MKFQFNSSRQHERPQNSCTADHRQPCQPNMAFVTEKPQRGVSRAERRTCTREQSRHRHSERSSHSSENDDGALFAARLSSGSAREAAGARSRMSFQSCEATASGIAGSDVDERLEISESERRGLIAVADETEIQCGDSLTYVLAAVLLSDGANAAQAMRELVSGPDRVRDFHWKKEGPKNRDGSLQLIRQHATGIHVLAQTTSRGGNEDARAALLTELLDRLANDDVDHLIIESRGKRNDELDRAAILDWNRRGGSLEFTYGWRSKKEPLLWFADALAGASRAAVADGDLEPIAGLQCDHMTPRVEWVHRRRQMRKPRLPS